MSIDIRMWAKFEFDPDSKATPKYKLSENYKWVEELQSLVGKNGFISLYLCQKREGQPSDAPAMYLQAKGSYNLTGLKDLYRDNKPSGFAYGYPFNGSEYGGKKPMPDPLLKYKDDGFVFLFNYGNNGLPKSFEMLWLCGAKQMITQHCKTLEIGGYDEELKKCRAEANPYNKG